MIELERPSWLFGLLGLVALWLLRHWWRKRRRRPVASLPMLERALARLGATRPGSIWRERLRDLAALVTLTAIVLALAKPIVVVSRPAATEYAIVVDVSASMSTRESDGRERLDWARDAVREILDRRGPRERFLLAVVAEETEVIAPLGTPPGEILRRLGSLRTRPRSENLIQAIQRVRPPSAAQRRVVLVSDFSSPRARQLAAMPPSDVFIHPVGVAIENWALANAVWLPSDPERPDLLRFEIVDHTPNGNASIRPVEISIHADGELLRSSTVDLPHGGRVTVEEPVVFPGDRVISISLPAGGSNALALDDRVDFVISGRARIPVRVWLGEPEDERLRDLLDVLGEELFDVERLGAADELWTESASPKVPVIAVGLDLDRSLPPGRYLLFQTSGARSPALTTSQELASGTLVVRNPVHPIVRHLTFDDVAIPPSESILLEEGEAPLLAASEKAVAVVRDRSDARVVSVSFRSDASTWWSSASFPLFVIQSLRWLTSAQSPLPASGILGHPIPLDPDWGDHPARAPALPAASQPGVFRVTSLPGSPAVGIHFESAGESQVAPGGPAAPRPAPEHESHRRDLASWLAVIALAAVLLMAWL